MGYTNVGVSFSDVVWMSFESFYGSPPVEGLFGGIAMVFANVS